MASEREKNLGITPRAQSYSDWYNDLVLKAELADYSPVRGCMVIRPYGWALWENIRDALDRMFKDTGHQNAAFPLFIPMSFLAREAEHVEGFAKECALVTHSRLKGIDGGVAPDPDSRLDEPLVVRPTSETIINAMYARWVQSYRDLPLLLNQWGNVVRWEMRTRLFLRTAEFYWQEGHTVHETEAEARAEVAQMLEIYRTVAEEHLAIPVYAGRKSDAERFAGAVETWTIEALMQDLRALQAGTSHHLGQNFAKAFGVKFQGRDGKEHFAWQTSWGASTRLVGALVMVHGDDRGLVLPPRVAPTQVVVVPIYRSDEERAAVNQHVAAFREPLRRAGVRVEVDARDHYKPGFKYHEWELKGVPLRLEVGPRDVAAGQVVVARRDGGEKRPLPVAALPVEVPRLLEEIQRALFEKAREFRHRNTHRATSFDELVTVVQERGGFVLAPWDGDAEAERQVKDAAGATIRCIREQDRGERVPAIVTGAETDQWAMFARAY